MSVLREPHTHDDSTPARRHQHIERLIVATAGDDASLGAIHVGIALAHREAAAVTAIAVMPPFSPAVHGVLAPSPLASNEDGRLELLGVLRETLAAVPGTEQWEKRAVIGMPASVINGLAGDAPRALILMGLGHHGRLDRLFGGETTVPVIQHAKVPVLVVASDARVLPRRAVAAVDFSEASMAAAAVAAELLDDDGTLTLAHVDSFGDAKAQPGDLVDLYRAGARARLDAALRQVQRRTHRRVNGTSLHGEIAEALLEYAGRAKCDLIALGGHELGLVDRILLGSIRTKVVRGAKCSVLIAPPEQHGTDA
jgi:nucleotide-binding universal stress UspA family protein